jgi:hypothetical protein
MFQGRNFEPPLLTSNRKRAGIALNLPKLIIEPFMQIC